MINRMNINLSAVFNNVKQLVPELGFDRKFKLLGNVPGPENPDWIKGKVLYEIYVRAFSAQGTFNGVTDRLPELKDLGIDFLWLMPIYPIGQKNRKGTLGSPYAIQDYFTVNPEYGSEQDFKNLIERAHALSMKVIIDMVPNHVAPDFARLTQQPELIARNNDGSPKRKITDWTDVADLDYSHKQTRQFMAEVMKFWIIRFDVDGYRCDVAGLVPLDFWQRIIPQLRNLKRDFYLLAEWESPVLHKTGFNSTYDWSTLRLLRLTFKGKIKPVLLADWVLTKSALYPQNSLPLRFLENHDLPRARKVFPGEQLLAALTFSFSLHGIPLIYNGQEIGADRSPSLFEKESIPWSKKDERLYGKLKELIELRKNTKALQSNEYFFLDDALKQRIFVFNKKDEVQVLINVTSHVKKLQPSWLTNVNIILFNSLKEFRKENGFFVLDPYQAIILKL